MADVRRLINQILADPRLTRSRAFADRVYSDEPILSTGSQMAGYLPERYHVVRDLATSPEARLKPDRWVFYQQARLMEDFEDDCPYRGLFERYYPTYQAMSDRQLRGYVTWRTRVRAGEVEETSLSFVFVYLYELLCGIGTQPGEPAFRAIEGFWQRYREFEPKLDRYARIWLRDYAIYHDLPRELVEPYVSLAFDRAAISLERCIGSWQSTDGATDEGLEQTFARALDELSSYRPRVSRLWRERPETLRHVCCDVIAQLAAYYDKHRKLGLVDTLFGTVVALPHEMFASAVFYDPEPHPNATYEFDEINRYTCSNGNWSWKGRRGSHGRNAKLGAVLRACDQRLRDTIDYPHPLSAKGSPKYLQAIIDKAIARRLAWEKAHEPVRIDIDLSKLRGIRAAASQTREALLIDEERGEGLGFAEDGQESVPGTSTTMDQDAPTPGANAVAAEQGGAMAPRRAAPPGAAQLTLDDVMPERRDSVGAPTGLATGPAPVDAVSASPASASPAQPAPSPAAPSPPDAAEPGLSPAEAAYLQALLDGTSRSDAVAMSGMPETMLVDAINERLFDLLGDVAIEFGEGGEPAVIEDYADDVRGAIQ